MEESSTPHLSSFGANPRLVPRPKYPSIFVALKYQAKTLFWTSGILGTLLVLGLQPVYKAAVADLERRGIHDEALIFTILLNGCHSLLWLAVNIPLLMFDHFGMFQEFKLHRTSGQKPSAGLVRENIITSIVMQLTISPILGYYLHPHFKSLGLMPLGAALPSPRDIFITMLGGHVFNDVMFYLTHRAFHSKALYFLHKQHHTFAGTIGPAAEHANPVETVVANIFPTFYGVIFFGCKHPLVVFGWFIMRLQETYMAHSGFAFVNTWFDWIGLAHADEAIFHDHHHTKNQGNFGCMLLDHLCETMDSFAAGGLHEGYLMRGKAGGGEGEGKKKQ